MGKLQSVSLAKLPHGIYGFSPAGRSAASDHTTRAVARYLHDDMGQTDVLYLPCPNGCACNSPLHINRGLLIKGQELISRIKEVAELFRLKNRRFAELRHSVAPGLRTRAQARFQQAQAIWRAKAGTLQHYYQQVRLPVQPQRVAPFKKDVGRKGG